MTPRSAAVCTDHMRVNILGVNIDAVTRKGAIGAAAAFLSGDRGRLIFTPNPEMLVLARRDDEFKQVLNSADLAIPDGTGLLWAAKWAGQSLPERVAGSDLMQDIVALAAASGQSVFLLGGEPGVADRAAGELQRRHPELVVAGAMSGGKVRRGPDGRLAVDRAVREALRVSCPAVLLVAFGHGKQEKWIWQNIAALPSVRLAMGVGGSFDFIIGKASRAPLFMRKLGLEWLWRLILEPRRWRRIWDAVVVFPFLLITEKN